MFKKLMFHVEQLWVNYALHATCPQRKKEKKESKRKKIF